MNLDQQLDDLLRRLHRECIIADEWLHPEDIAPGLSRALARELVYYLPPSEMEHERSYFLTKKGRAAIGRPNLVERVATHVQRLINGAFD